MSKKSLTGQVHHEPVKKRTSIGHGLRKRGSFSNSKKYRGQGKG
jgi:hypothetical protein